MTTYQRRQKLLDILKNEPGLRVPEIASRFSVSEGTVRNDLNALALSGQVLRVRGGAAHIEGQQTVSPAFTIRSNLNADLKDLISRLAARNVKDGDSILLDASTTVYAMAQHLQDRKGLRVISNGIEVARLLASNPTNTVILLGGILRQDGASITGSLSEKILKDLHIGSAYVSCSGFSFSAGLTEVDIHEAQLKEIAIRSSLQVIALVDSTKFGKSDLTSFARLDQLSHLYTDPGLTSNWREQLIRTGVNFTVCDEKQS